jgi:acyl-CoA thioesterase
MSDTVIGEPPIAFDTHTAVEDVRPGVVRATLTPDLTGFGGTHGGYVATIALRAMTRLVGERNRTVRSLAVDLLAPITPGPLELLPSQDRAGSSMSAVTVRLEQDGEIVATARALFGSTRPSLAYAGLAMPDVPPPEACQPIAQKPAPEALAGLLVEHRPAAPPLPLSGGERAEILVWMRTVERRPLDALSLTMLADAAPPALFGHLRRFVAIPSVEIALHFAELPAATRSPWVLGDIRTTHAGGGYAIEDAELWTPAGELVLQVRQLRRIVTPQPLQELR